MQRLRLKTLNAKEIKQKTTREKVKLVALGVTWLKKRRILISQ